MAQTKETTRALRITAKHTIKVSAVFDTYWRFAHERQQVFLRRFRGLPAPWTNDDLLTTHRFTNVFRASDRVSQYLIRHVIYSGDQSPAECFFRTLLFKLFNRIDTWERLTASLGQLSLRTFEEERYAAVLDAALARGEKVYSAAYIMPSPRLGSPRKHRNHLRLLRQMIRTNAPERIANAGSLAQVYEILRAYPSIGNFLAFQFAIDLNYAEFLRFSEMDFVVAGPGARDGIRKCVLDPDGLDPEDIIRAVADLAPMEFRRLGLEEVTLFGRRLQLIDCQNLFCEVDKYSRVVHPEIAGQSGRTRIKQRFHPRGEPLDQWYPPKWKLSLPHAQPKQATLALDLH